MSSHEDFPIDTCCTCGHVWGVHCGVECGACPCKHFTPTDDASSARDTFSCTLCKLPGQPVHPFTKDCDSAAPERWRVYLDRGDNAEEEPARKFDSGKLRWDLLPASIEELLKPLQLGAEKYSPWEWRKGLAWSRVFAAIMRHLTAFWFKGESQDAEGFHHLGAVAAMCLWLIDYDQNKIGTDDRVYPPRAGSGPQLCGLCHKGKATMEKRSSLGRSYICDPCYWATPFNYDVTYYGIRS